MKASRLLTAGALLTTLGGPLACSSVEAPGRAVVISPEVPFLESQVTRALGSLHEARSTLPADDDRALAALAEAEAALVRLQSYYLPLLEARQRASNAHQLAADGQVTRAQKQLEDIEAILLALARGGGEQTGRQVQDPLDLLEEARVALARNAPEAPDRLEELAARLELMLLKGELVQD
jgi:hypothetical protein